MRKNLKVLRLLTGEEIIAEAKYRIDGNSYDLNNPLVIMFDGKNVVFRPFCIWTKETAFTLNAEHVTFVVDAGDEISAFYTQQTTGLAVPPKQSIIIP